MENIGLVGCRELVASFLDDPFSKVVALLLIIGRVVIAAQCCVIIRQGRDHLRIEVFDSSVG